MSEYHPEYDDHDPTWHKRARPVRDQGEHPVVSKPTPNVDKLQFMLTYFIAARRGGRSVDAESPDERCKLAKAAGDLYDRAETICNRGV